MTENNYPTETPVASLHSRELPPGTRFAEFELLDVIGAGGFGIVYRAYDHALCREVAIKEYMPLELTVRAQDLTIKVRGKASKTLFADGVAAFIKEARLLARFDHPSLVRVLRFWQANNTVYMLMPLYRGMTLKQARALMLHAPSEEWLRKVLWSILGALHLLHDNDVLHRDVSPDNIFLQDVGPPVLLDLGTARQITSIAKDTDGEQAAIKLSYAPIEQYTATADQADMPQGPWTDLYALCVTIHEMLSNVTPPPAATRLVKDRMLGVRQITRTLREQIGLEYSRPFVIALQHGLMVQPASRVKSIASFVNEMELSEPAGRLMHFNWRKELGDNLPLQPGAAPPEAQPERPADEHATGEDPPAASAPPDEAAEPPTSAQASDSGATPPSSAQPLSAAATDAFVDTFAPTILQSTLIEDPAPKPEKKPHHRKPRKHRVETPPPPRSPRPAPPPRGHKSSTVFWLLCLAVMLAGGFIYLQKGGFFAEARLERQRSNAPANTRQTDDSAQTPEPAQNQPAPPELEEFRYVHVPEDAPPPPPHYPTPEEEGFHR